MAGIAWIVQVVPTNNPVVTNALGQFTNPSRIAIARIINMLVDSHGGGNKRLVEILFKGYRR